MANLSYQSSSTTGLALTFSAASAGGDAVDAVGDGIVLVRNGDAAAKTVTIAVPGSDRYGLDRPDYSFSVAAGATAALGPFPAELADATTGRVQITYSAVTSVTVAALRVLRP